MDEELRIVRDMLEKGEADGLDMLISLAQQVPKKDGKFSTVQSVADVEAINSWKPVPQGDNVFVIDAHGDDGEAYTVSGSTNYTPEVDMKNPIYELLQPGNLEGVKKGDHEFLEDLGYKIFQDKDSEGDNSFAMTYRNHMVVTNKEGISDVVKRLKEDAPEYVKDVDGMSMQPDYEGGELRNDQLEALRKIGIDLYQENGEDEGLEANGSVIYWANDAKMNQAKRLADNVLGLVRNEDGNSRVQAHFETQVTKLFEKPDAILEDGKYVPQDSYGLTGRTTEGKSTFREA